MYYGWYYSVKITDSKQYVLARSGTSSQTFLIEAKEINMAKSIELFNDKNLKIGELRSGTYSPHFEKVIGIYFTKLN